MFEARAEGIERAGADVAVNDAERNECQLSEPLAGWVRLRMFRDWEILLRSFPAVRESIELPIFLQDLCAMRLYRHRDHRDHREKTFGFGTTRKALVQAFADPRSRLVRWRSKTP